MGVTRTRRGVWGEGELKEEKRKKKEMKASVWPCVCSAVHLSALSSNLLRLHCICLLLLLWDEEMKEDGREGCQHHHNQTEIEKKRNDWTMEWGSEGKSRKKECKLYGSGRFIHLGHCLSESGAGGWPAYHLILVSTSFYYMHMSKKRNKLKTMC